MSNEHGHRNDRDVDRERDCGGRDPKEDRGGIVSLHSTLSAARATEAGARSKLAVRNNVDIMPILFTSTHHPAENHPRVFVRSIRLDTPLSITDHIPEAPSALWLHESGGLIGIGAAARIEATGAGRFDDLAHAFRAVSERAEVEDCADLRGSGLVAFTSFSYSPNSSRPSRLVIPRYLLGSVEGCAFLTSVRTEAEPGVGNLLTKPEEILELFAPNSIPTVAPRAMQPAHSGETYRGLVKDAVQDIDDGVAEKIVLSERFEIDLGALEAKRLVPALAAQLHRRYPTAWTFALDDIVGASPEMLVRTEGSHVFSRVLAGSRPVSGDDELSVEDRHAFLHDPKERSEHEFAARSVREPLEKLGVHLSPPGPPFVLHLPGIEHLATDIRGITPEGLGILEIAGALHPSAAVSGTPLAAANEVIARLEGVDRAGYASPVGWIGADGDGELAIALRMAHVHGNTLTIQAGGGLVSDSDPLTEHAEALAKTRPIARALSALSSPEE